MAVLGAGRLGNALAQALASAGLRVSGPYGRGGYPSAEIAPDVVLLCVPDADIAAAAAEFPAAQMLAHCSGAGGLDLLGGHAGFSLHPLTTVTAAGADFTGVGAAVDATSPQAHLLAHTLAGALGMRPFHLAADDRVAYHAAASMASNFLVTLEAAAERLASSTGLDRELLVPLVRASVENWAALGPERALTGPVARGDRHTVERQRGAVTQRTPDLLPLFDAMVGATGHLSAREDRAAMQTIRTVAELRAALAPARRAEASIGLVPTMGALHEGHLSLIRRARETCDVVVVSLFVNPAQFDEGSDLAAYPRDEQRDAQLAAAAGADYLFAPGVAEVYPDGFSTTVGVARLTETLEGAQRGRGHFDGVTTVVTKLLNMVGPGVAFFGQKDAQQALVVTRLVRDLDMPTRIEICPTVREPDGLALSSRNVHLDPAQRRRATALSRALEQAAALVGAGELDAAVLRAAARDVLDAAGVETEYFALVDPRDLTPITHITGPALALVAARLGSTRLIDNRLLEPVPATAV